METSEQIQQDGAGHLPTFSTNDATTHAQLFFSTHMGILGSWSIWVLAITGILAVA